MFMVEIFHEAALWWTCRANNKMAQQIDILSPFSTFPQDSLQLLFFTSPPSPAWYWVLPNWLLNPLLRHDESEDSRDLEYDPRIQGGITPKLSQTFPSLSATDSVSNLHNMRQTTEVFSRSVLHAHGHFWFAAIDRGYKRYYRKYSDEQQRWIGNCVVWLQSAVKSSKTVDGICVWAMPANIAGTS